MWISINGKFFDKTRKEAKEAQVSNIGEVDQAEEDSLVWDDLDMTIEAIEISEDSIDVSVSNKLGYFSIAIPLDSSILEEIISVTIKKMNKVKTVLEGLK